MSTLSRHLVSDAFTYDEIQISSSILIAHRNVCSALLSKFILNVTTKWTVKFKTTVYVSLKPLL